MKAFQFLRYPIFTLIGITLLEASMIAPSTNVLAQAATSTPDVQPMMSQCNIIDILVMDANAATSEATASVDSTPEVTATQPTAETVVLPTKSAPEVTSGEAGDEALTTYRDTTQGFSIDYPQSWSQVTNFHNGICFTARDASIAVQLVKGTPPTDLMSYVQKDEANVQMLSPNYKQVYLKSSTEVQGAVILGYEWDAGKSIVTEKPVRARTDRYYLVDSTGRLVIVTETEPVNQFDPDGVRDTALTYQVVK